MTGEKDKALPGGAIPKQIGAGGFPRPPARRREIDSAELFAGSREIGIRHAGEIYTLRQTSKGKLILTK
ncbi:MAG: hemin uptake protein HemP [Pseudomonadota bacterium]